jgi:hypothetical protein
MAAVDDALAVVRAYHAAWTGRRFDEARALLAAQLAVEAPINEYSTRDSFAEALAAFGGLVRDVELLAELAGDREAMLLYDMAVEGLGRLRVAEHFTVVDGKIAGIRQVHDTEALRAAGFGG